MLRERQWRCLPASDAGDISADGYYGCDDASDCQAPRVCCRHFSSAVEAYGCEVATGNNCSAQVCALPDGTSCPKGQQCRDGYCSPKTAASCGPGLTCTNDAAPFCAWGSAPECVSVARAEQLLVMLDDASPVKGVYACTKPSDCGSFECCTSMVYAEKHTMCSHACDLANSQLVCQRDADCAASARAHCGGDPECRRNVRCVAPRAEPHGSLPASLKVCELTRN